MESTLISRCVLGFAQNHNLTTDQIQVVNTYEKSIQLQRPPGPGEVSAGILTKCLFVDVESPIGNYTLYTPLSGKGKLYWKQK